MCRWALDRYAEGLVQEAIVEKARCIDVADGELNVGDPFGEIMGLIPREVFRRYREAYRNLRARGFVRVHLAGSCLAWVARVR